MDFVVPDLKVEPREGGYARGQEGFEQILRAALSVFIESGYKALTMRRIAAECGMNAGNLSYYFKSKNELVRALLDAVVKGYEETITQAVEEASGDPALKLKNLILLICEDITTKKTTFIFPELWTLANHDPFVRDRINELYAREHEYFKAAIHELNPPLSDTECDVVAAFIMGSLEGLTVFAGYERPWRASMPLLEAAACDCFITFVRDVRPGQLSAGTDNLGPRKLPRA